MSTARSTSTALSRSVQKKVGHTIQVDQLIHGCDAMTEKVCTYKRNAATSQPAITKAANPLQPSARCGTFYLVSLVADEAMTVSSRSELPNGGESFAPAASGWLTQHRLHCAASPKAPTQRISYSLSAARRPQGHDGFPHRVLES
jgi:hypothetical protein